MIASVNKYIFLLHNFTFPPPPNLKQMKVVLSETAEKKILIFLVILLKNIIDWNYEHVVVLKKFHKFSFYALYF